MEKLAPTNLKKYLLEECFAMVKHLSAEGKEIPIQAKLILNCDSKSNEPQSYDEKEVLHLHQLLSKKIAPARPKTVWLLYKESQKTSIFHFLGPVKLIRRLMFTAIFSLIMYIIISLSKWIDPVHIMEGIYNLNGEKLFVILMFYVMAASLGASFSNLYVANKYLVQNTFDPKFESSYWIRYIMGVIAGIMLATIIPIPDDFLQNIAPENSSIAGHNAVSARPLMAMLGGFSANLVNRILFRLVFTVESLFVGKQSDVSDQKIKSMKETAEAEVNNEQQRTVNKLLEIQGKLKSGKSIDELNDDIENSIKGITG